MLKVLYNLPRPVIHHKCIGCHGCKSSHDHIIPKSMLKSSEAQKDPHNMFIICDPLNKEKGNKSFFSTKLSAQLTNDGKGAIARSLLYMKLRHDIDIPDVSLIQSWDQLYPPNKDEIDRNTALSQKYGPNPFIQ